jgi:hypothetical protein
LVSSWLFAYFTRLCHPVSDLSSSFFFFADSYPVTWDRLGGLLLYCTEPATDCQA